MNHELPLKTDLVVWMPLSDVQSKIYKFILENQTLQQLIEDRQFQNAFYILSYLKKLCLHPYLLAATTNEKKRQIGLMIINEEQEELERINKEVQSIDNASSDRVIRTRNSMQVAR